MEVLMIDEWAKISYRGGHGYGTGVGEGKGKGCGWGNDEGMCMGHHYCALSYDILCSAIGHGSINGKGYGDGYGCGYNNFYGDRCGSASNRGNVLQIASFCGHKIYNIDGIPTIIKSIKGNIAKGFILQIDFTLKSCYVAKNEEYFAHGETIESAVKALRDKMFEKLNTKETIERFISEFKNIEKIKGTVLFEWHHYLTGSCLMGRNDFVQRKGLNLEDEFTVDEFITLCENEFGSEIIEKLKERWAEEKKGK